MKAVVQRVSRASVIVDGQVIAAIGQGMLILVGAGIGDSDVQARALVDKIVHLRIYEDEAGKMNRSVLETGGEAIVVSQFTLYADTRKGRRPSFTDAAPPDTARPLVDTFAGLMRSAGVPTKTGAFGTHMLVELENDGPVTIILETPHGT